MKLKSFSVVNYKVFNEKITLNFSYDNVVILTGRNNTGKSTFLEALHNFYLKPSAKNQIKEDCYHNQDINNPIEMEAEFLDDSGETFTVIKEYKNDKGKYYDTEHEEIKGSHPQKPLLDTVLNTNPYYITPFMTTEQINSQVQEIYADVISSKLLKLEEQGEEVEEENRDLLRDYIRMKESIPNLLSSLKGQTDQSLETISSNVSENLQTLFSNPALNLKVSGGESLGFTVNDIVKSTNSEVLFNHDQSLPDMPLSNQGTGVQRMSLIYIIQNLIQEGMLGNSRNKMLLIDEPEAFLHPEAIRALSRSLYNIGAEMPLIISTHSPVLIDLSQDHTAIQVFRISDQPPVELFQSSNNEFSLNDIENVKILNYVDSYINEFFFADKIIIVEGDTEYIALKEYIKDTDSNIHVIRARGKATIRTLMKVLNQFGTPYYILHDIDNNEDIEQPYLKAQRTNCLNIFELKSEHCKIFGSVSNFEQATGIGDVKNKEKTTVIQKVLKEEEGFSRAKSIIYELFKQIFDTDTDFNMIPDFIEITSKNCIKEQFEALIEE